MLVRRGPGEAIASSPTKSSSLSSTSNSASSSSTASEHMNYPEVPEPPGSVIRCSSCNTKVGTLKFCAKCRRIQYCSRDCQRKAWPTHKLVCKEPPAFHGLLEELERRFGAEYKEHEKAREKAREERRRDRIPGESGETDESEDDEEDEELYEMIRKLT